MKHLVDRRESPSEEKETTPNRSDWKKHTEKDSHMIPFQLIGLKKEYESDEDFAEAVLTDGNAYTL